MSGDRLHVLGAILEQGVVPVFYDPDFQVCVDVIQACADGGAKCVEFTNRGDFAHALFARIAQHFAQHDPSVILGIGSLVDAPTASLFIASGANFVVGPVLNADIARLCNRRKVAYIPGCGSATEISQAEELGCEIVKLFPGGAVGGPDFVRAVLGPMPWSKIMPTGGVEPNTESLKAWFDAGVAACGIGSNLIEKKLLAARDFAAIKTRVRDVLALARTVRKSKS